MSTREFFEKEYYVCVEEIERKQTEDRIRIAKKRRTNEGKREKYVGKYATNQSTIQQEVIAKDSKTQCINGVWGHVSRVREGVERECV